MHNFYYKRRGKENLPLALVDRFHFMKGLTISTTSEDTKGRLADPMLSPSNDGTPSARGYGCCDVFYNPGPPADC